MNNFSISRHNTAVLKGIAICGMLLLHLYACPISDSIDSYSGFPLWIGTVGRVCVSLFLFCSGYGLSVQYHSFPKSFHSSSKFVLKRLIKFYTNYWTVFILFVPISILCFNRTLEIAYQGRPIIPSFIIDILGIAGYRSFNVTWWFNRWILFLYLLFPAIHWITHKIGAFPSTIIGFVILLYPFVYEIHLLQFPFLLGIIWEMTEESSQIIRLYNRKPHLFLAICGMFTFLLVYLRIFPPSGFLGTIYIDPFLACSICALVLCISSLLKRDMHVLSFLGSHSTNIYMIHTFLYLYWFPNWFHQSSSMRNGGNFFILMGICLILSILIEWLKKKLGIISLSRFLISKLSLS